MQRGQAAATASAQRGVQVRHQPHAWSSALTAESATDVAALRSIGCSRARERSDGTLSIDNSLSMRSCFFRQQCARKSCATRHVGAGFFPSLGADQNIVRAAGRTADSRANQDGQARVSTRTLKLSVVAIWLQSGPQIKTRSRSYCTVSSPMTERWDISCITCRSR